MTLKTAVFNAKSRYVVVILTFLSALLSSGCATMEGAGEDIKSAGEAVEESAQEASQ